MNINHTRDLVRQGNAYYDPTVFRHNNVKKISMTWLFVHGPLCVAMKRHLSPEDEDEADFQAELYEKLPAQQAQKIIDAAHRPNRALQDLSYSIENLPMHFMRKNEIHKACTIFEDNLGIVRTTLDVARAPLLFSSYGPFCGCLALVASLCTLRSVCIVVESHCHDSRHSRHFRLLVWY